MATILNNPNDGSNNGGWIVAIVAIVILLILAFLFFPVLFGMNQNTVEPVTPTQNDANDGGNDISVPPIINNTFNSTTTVNTSTTTDDE